MNVSVILCFLLCFSALITCVRFEAIKIEYIRFAICITHTYYWLVRDKLIPFAHPSVRGLSWSANCILCFKLFFLCVVFFLSSLFWFFVVTNWLYLSFICCRFMHRLSTFFQLLLSAINGVFHCFHNYICQLHVPQPWSWCLDIRFPQKMYCCYLLYYLIQIILGSCSALEANDKLLCFLPLDQVRERWERP